VRSVRNLVYVAAFIPTNYIPASAMIFVLWSLWWALKRERRTVCHSEQSL
jgi:hypothetical protein